MDNGFPLTTEPNILSEMIAPPNIVSKMLSVVTGKSSNVSSTLPDAAASCVPWRKSDLKNARNEIYVDLVEEMDAVVSRSDFTILYTCSILIMFMHVSCSLSIFYFFFLSFLKFCLSCLTLFTTISFNSSKIFTCFTN